MKKLSYDTKQKLLKLFIIALLFLALFLAIYLPLKLTGAFAKIDSAEKLKEIILSAGAYSYILFCLIQFLQTTILPIPAMVTTIAGSLIFGPWVTILLSIVSVLAGSLFSFFLGKKLGFKIICWIAGENDGKKWAEKLGKGKFAFFLMMLLPVFPDDILCLVAGATDMSYKFFIITNLITRPIAIISTCLLGGGTLIPFSGWGIPILIILVALMGFAFFFSIRYEKQIEAFILKLSKKLEKQPKQDNPQNSTDSSISKDEN